MNAVEQSAVEHSEESTASNQGNNFDNSGHSVVDVVIGPLHGQLILSHLPPVDEEKHNSKDHITSDGDKEEDSGNGVVDVRLLVGSEHHGQGVAPNGQLQRTHEGGHGRDEGSGASEYFNQQQEEDDNDGSDEHGEEHNAGRETVLALIGHHVGVVGQRALLHASVSVLEVEHCTGSAVGGCPRASGAFL